jgi:hypothetical protein
MALQASSSLRLLEAAPYMRFATSAYGHALMARVRAVFGAAPSACAEKVVAEKAAAEKAAAEKAAAEKAAAEKAAAEKAAAEKAAAEIAAAEKVVAEKAAAGSVRAYVHVLTCATCDASMRSAAAATLWPVATAGRREAIATVGGVEALLTLLGIEGESELHAVRALHVLANYAGSHGTCGRSRVARAAARAVGWRC